METIECIKTRRSVRKYKKQPIERDTIEKIVNAASYAPSWKNTQIVRYNIVTDREKVSAIATKAVLGFEHNSKIILDSTLLAVQTVITGISGYEPDGTYTTDKKDGWEMYDAGISAQTFCLAAHNYGVGTVIMGIFDDEKIREILGIPDAETVTAVICMGYPVETQTAPARKDTGELLRYI